MGAFDFLSGTKRPAAGTPSLPAPAVLEQLMALNRATAPWQIISGTAENVDLIDARWYEVFGKTSLTKVFRIYLKLDPSTHEVRAMDREYSLSWSAGIPSLTLAVSSFKGQSSSVEFGSGYAFTETLAPGQVYKYKFNSNELKKPIQDVVTGCGWVYKGVAFGKL
jgi:hypothetical protein